MQPVIVSKDSGIKELLRINKQLSRRIQEKDKEISKLQAQLAQAGKLASLGLQGAGIAHELNNPLTVISAEADEILDAFEEGRFDRKRTQHSAQNIKSFSERMRVIIDHIRQYTREDKKSSWTAINVNDPINDSLLLLKRQLETSGISVNTGLAENLPQIWGQYNKLESIFQNLITNARDAFELVTDGRNKTLDITSELDQDKIVVKIRDNGCGMTKDVVNKIYSPFFTTKTRDAGTGIGLSIAHNIVKEHHGEILVSSIPGQGTAFILRFPLERRNRMSTKK